MTMNPCRDHCYIRYNKQYTSECDTECEFAIAMKKLKEASITIEKLEQEKHRAVECIEKIRLVLNHDDTDAAFKAIKEYLTSILSEMTTKDA